MNKPPSSIPDPQSLLKSLNPEQQAAVCAPAGPLLILAGAGTGKTRVIAHRIAYRLASDPQLQPGQILAVTFSRRAAEEMRQRVDQLCDTAAESIQFFTFHGFCHSFLQDHAIRLGLPARFRLLDSTEAWIFFRSLLPELKLKHFWNLTDPTASIDGFLRFISRAKDELVFPAELLARSKQEQDSRDRSEAEEIARAYRIYQQRMHEAGFLDFGDLIVETIRALKERPALLQQMRQRFRLILVDEFQDTNVAQIELLKLVAGPQADLCVVGDDDQAIYRFRGASFSSFLLMKEAFPSLATVRLTQNYRSGPAILAASERLIRHNEPDRYDPQKKLWTDNKEMIPVQVEYCLDDLHETETALRIIRQRYQSQPEAERRWDRTAVLYRAHAHRDKLLQRLRREGIPFSVRGGFDLMEQPQIRDLTALLRVVDNPDDSVSLFRLLAHPVWGIAAEDLLAITRLARERKMQIYPLLKTIPGGLISAEAVQPVRQLLEEISQLRDCAARMEIDLLVNHIVSESFLKVIFRLPPTEQGNPWMLLGRFLRLVSRFVQTYPKAARLPDFLVYLDCLEKAPSSDLGSDEESDDARQDGVRLMTVHQAKGLEFDQVILLGMVQNRFPGRARSEAIPFPLDLMKESLPKGDYHLQEERRLCYVACTRAQRQLVLLTQDRSRYRPSVFLREMAAGAAAEEWKEFRASEPAAPSETTILESNPERTLLVQEREWLDLLDQLRQTGPAQIKDRQQLIGQIELFAKSVEPVLSPELPVKKPVPLPERLSFSQMETYRYCPLKYLYAYVYRIPVKSAPYMLFGTDLHDALEWFYQQRIEGNTPPREELAAHYEKLYETGRYGEAYVDAQYKKLGDEILQAYYRKHEKNWTTPLFLEKEFTLKIGEVAVHGFIDRIDPLPGGGVEIIDYKSGKPKEGATSEGQLQIRLYALAARDLFGLDPKQATFYYLRDQTALSFPQQAEDLDATRERVFELTQLIRSGNFDPIPSAIKCKWCDFRTLCPASKA